MNKSNEVMAQQDEREVLIDALRNEQNNLAASRQQCRNWYDVARWDALQRVIDYLATTQQVQAGGEDKRYRIGAAWKRGGSAGYTRTSLPENARDGQYQLWAELIQPFTALSREQPQPSNGDREGGAV